jgi:hypothetical protein
MTKRVSMGAECWREMRGENEKGRNELEKMEV